MRRKAVVAMSGGVDSSVTAALLVDQGYDVTGIMLKLWKGEAANNNSGCCNLGAAEDARRVADKLGIPFYVLNFAETFEETVIRNFHADYSAGRTPNPCVRCNQWVKFGTLLERAEALGADVLATGHYARLRRRSDGSFGLFRGIDTNKDQSYVLWMLTQRELARTLFPVGEMHKSETRAIAEELGLRTARKPDSQEICFVREGDLGAYVGEHIPAASEPGPVVDASGEVLGQHGGIARYTVGQRKGLGIALGTPVFVTGIDAATNTVQVGSREDLRVAALRLDEVAFTSQAVEGEVLVQHRAHGAVTPGRLRTFCNEARFPGLVTERASQKTMRPEAEVVFEAPVEGIAPGQSAAFYSADDPDELVGGGVISSTVPVGVPA